MTIILSKFRFILSPYLCFHTRYLRTRRKQICICIWVNQHISSRNKQKTWGSYVFFYSVMLQNIRRHDEIGEKIYIAKIYLFQLQINRRKTLEIGQLFDKDSAVLLIFSASYLRDGITRINHFAIKFKRMQIKFVVNMPCVVCLDLHIVSEFMNWG